jgi:NTE family protein
MSAAGPTAFVLAGGGSLGAVQAGMLHELLAYGEYPDFVVGASAGAINAAYFAGTPDRSGVAKLRQLWCAVRRRDIMPISAWSLLRALIYKRSYLASFDAMRRMLQVQYDYRRIEEARLPLHIVATDRLLGEEVVLSQGILIDAVTASAAIPGIFPPVLIDGRELVDGGICNNTPISVAVNLGAKRIIVLPAGFACALQRPPVGVVAHALQALSLLVARQLVHDLERYQGTVTIFVAPPLCPLDISPYDYSACSELIERALVSTRQWLHAGGLNQPVIPAQLRPHQHPLQRDLPKDGP